jgi:hypothetical protein
MDLAAADDDHQLVAGLLQRQAALNGVRVLARHLDRPAVAEEVGRVQHVDVQRVALDPLPAVEKPAQDPDRLAHLDPAEILHRVDRAHLVRDRADAADAGRDVGRLEEGAAAQERLEEARRLEDSQLDLVDLAVDEPDRHRTFALDPGEVVSLDRAARRRAHAPSETLPR